MDRTKAQLMKDKVYAALVEVGKEFGVSVNVGRGSYSDESLTMKIEFAELNAGGVAMTGEVRALKTMAKAYGLPEDAYGRKFMVRGYEFKVVGLNPRSSKFPVIVERSDGKKFKYSDELVALKLNATTGV